jgi:hypothetical protein
VGSISLAGDFAWAVGLRTGLGASRIRRRLCRQDLSRDAERCTLFFLISLLEPAAILLMGAMVTPIVLAVLMPIIEINQLVHGSTRACK